MRLCYNTRLLALILITGLTPFVQAEFHFHDCKGEKRFELIANSNSRSILVVLWQNHLPNCQKVVNIDLELGVISCVWVFYRRGGIIADIYHSQNTQNTEWKSTGYWFPGRAICGQDQIERFGMVLWRLAARPHKKPRCPKATDVDKIWMLWYLRHGSRIQHRGRCIPDSHDMGTANDRSFQQLAIRIAKQKKSEIDSGGIGQLDWIASISFHNNHVQHIPDT